MDSIAEKLRSLLEGACSSPGILEYAILGLGAFLEYVFPPFPGDVVVLLGAFLVGRHGWSLPAVFLVVCAGSAVGLTVDYAFGGWVRKRDPVWRTKYLWWARLGASIDRFDVFYRRWGPFCIAANRFVPAVRAIFFVGAGMAGIRYAVVLILGLLSAALWNVLLLAVGVSVGHNWESLKEFLRSYTTAAWIVGIGVLVVIAIRVVLKRRKGSGPGRDGRPSRDGSARDGSARDGSARDGSAQDGSAQDGSAQDGSAQDGSARDGSLQDGPARDGSAQDRSAQG